MAKIKELNRPEFDQWVNERPECIQALVKKLPPDRLYLLKETNRRCFITAYHEDDTLTVSITGQYNWLMFERQVFGVKPEYLEECDLPEEGEKLGTFLNDDEAKQYINTLKK